MKTFTEILEDSNPFNTWWPFIIAVIVGVISTIRSYCGGPRCPSEASLVGKTVVITGGSSGVGLYVVAELLKRGGKVIVGSRDCDMALTTISGIIGTNELKNYKLVIKQLDLASLKSVKKFAKELANEPNIDILINNAGIAFHEFKNTEEGFELHLVTNYLSHFLLTHLLLPKLKVSSDARIINVSAQAHYVGDLFLDDMNILTNYHYNKAFGQSKLALVMMARHMSKLLQGTKVKINAMHPGIIRNTRQFKNSKMFDSIFVKIAVFPWIWLLLKTPQQGAQTIIYMAVATELKSITGKYFSNCKIIEPSEKAKDENLAAELYKKSLKLTGLSAEFKEVLDDYYI